MALQLESSAQDVKNTCGVKLEVPAFTIFSNLKYISKQPFENILVFYLKDFDKDIKKAIEMVQKEQLKLNAICVDCGFDGEMSEKEIAKKMKSEYEKAKDENKADVLWMLGDNRLLAQKSMADFWMPKIWSKKVPTIAPLAEMVDPKSPSGKMIGGLMALGADYPELGKQISDQVRRVLEDKEETSAIGFEDIISVQGVLNQKKADKIDWVINPDNVSRMKKIYE